MDISLRRKVIMKSTEGCFRSCSWVLWKALIEERCMGLVLFESGFNGIYLVRFGILICLYIRQGIPFFGSLGDLRA
jgi:hypothetical protein